MKGKRAEVRPEAKEKPTKKYQKRLVEEAKKQGVELEQPESVPIEEQQRLLDGGDVRPAIPQPVRGKLMLARYVRPHYNIDKDNRFIELEFSFPLTEMHRKLMPRKVEKAWKFVDGGGSDKVLSLGLAPHDVELFLVPDDDAALTLELAPITKESVVKIEDTGTGSAEEIIRFSFRVRCDVSNSNCHFADNQFGGDVWLTLTERQGELELDGEE